MRKFATVLGTLILSVLVAQFAWAGGGVLLVDDDGSTVDTVGIYPDVRPIYEAALQEAGFTPVPTAAIRGEYEVYDVTDTLGPPLSKLEQYEVVIWFTGAVCCSDPNCLSVEEEANLGAYLDGGGKLFLNAQDYLSYWPDGPLPTTSFPYQYLKVEICTTNVWEGTDHIAEGPPPPDPEAITEDMVFELENPFAKSGNLYIDKIVPFSVKVDAHHVVGEFGIYDAAGNGYAALSWNELGTYEGAHVFFTTVSFAALKDGEFPNTKGELMSRIMSWMLGDYADYGDAPDPPYPSLYESNGARHINSDGIFEWLGESIDLEFNSWQVDNDLFDDGVVFNTPYEPGGTGSVDVTVSVQQWDGGRYPPDLYLSAWFDWNQDDDWDDAGENVINSYSMNPLTEGWGSNSHTYNITFPVPTTATNNDMWTRFRLGYLYPLNLYYFEHAYGEVEDYVLGHPLSVGLSTFYASAGDGQATLFWTTESEVNNLGFYLLRSEADGEYVRVNEELIPGHGTSETRHEYRYVDRGLTNGVTYSYKLVDVDLAGTRTVHGPISVSVSAQVPTSYALSQNYPNPFNAQTTISYAIPTESYVSLKVFNILGEEVRTLVNSQQSANTYQVTWDGKDADGKLVASGVYFCTLKAGEFSKTMKMVFLK